MPDTFIKIFYSLRLLYDRVGADVLHFELCSKLFEHFEICDVMRWRIFGESCGMKEEMSYEACNP